MKVICIEKDPPRYNDPLLMYYTSILEVGVIYNVINELKGMYVLAEFPHPQVALWNKECFIPVSDIDETEFERNYNHTPCTTS